MAQLPVSTPTGDLDEVSAPVIGLRYWLKSGLGLDGGIGFGMKSGSTTTNGQSTSTPSVFGFALHAGLPIVLGTGKHYAFELIPETTLGFTSGSYTQPGSNGGSISLTGVRFDLGARAGAEINFGFMDLPQLSLVASVGVYVHDISYSATPSNSSNSSGASSLTVGTSVQNNPWSIFTDNISAIYYF